MNKYRILKEHIEEKYRELSEVSGEGELTPEGRGYPVGLGDILRFIDKLDKDLCQNDERDSYTAKHPSYSWNRKTHDVLDCYGIYIETIDTEAEFLKKYSHNKVYVEDYVIWLYN